MLDTPFLFICLCQHFHNVRCTCLQIKFFYDLQCVNSFHLHFMLFSHIHITRLMVFLFYVSFFYILIRIFFCTCIMFRLVRSISSEYFILSNLLFHFFVEVLPICCFFVAALRTPTNPWRY